MSTLFKDKNEIKRIKEAKYKQIPESLISVTQVLI